ncbi:MAG TPA: hypothetical protein VHH73_02175, partial [Verrucomicrobiae bacterium]|nr:hypothetical protein [Verrucomicrobiae bacterium]
MAKPNVLLLTLEYPRWADAGKYGYESNFGLEEGFAANGVSFTTMPMMFGDQQSPWSKWFNSIHRQLRGKRFDQVWFDVVHSNYPDGFLDFIQSLAPARIGYFGESSEFHPLELARNPEGVALRRQKVARALPYATHLIAVDEADVARFNADGKTPAFWWASGFIPRRFIAADPAPANANPALFHGTLYGNRQEWLARPELAGLLAQGTSLEDKSPWPAQYDELNRDIAEALTNGAELEDPMFSRFIGAIRLARQSCYPLWLQSLRRGCAVVNLPQFAQAYASR